MCSIPSLALAIFVAPVLLDAAYDTSLRDLSDNRLPIILLVVMAVGVTTAAVAVVFHAIVPEVPWAAAIALGAIVAPPDAAAATAVLRQVGIPNRLLQILEGESLFNDASALLIFAVAVRLVEDGDAELTTLVPTYAASVVGSILAGIALNWVARRLLRLGQDAPASIVLQFTTTYGVWVLAEYLELSPILTMVSYGMAIARFGGRTDPVLRIKSYAVWDTVVFLSNVLAFTLIGLQLGPILERLSPEQRTSYLLIAGVVLATVILARIAWVMSYNTWLRFKNWKFGINLPDRMTRPSTRGGIIISWSGMRGIVTLAAALALPGDFPQRDLIQFVAFVVALGTLVVQGFTLGPLVRLLHFPDDHQIDDEVALARRAALETAIATLHDDETIYAESLRVEYQALLELGDGSRAGGRVQLTGHETRRMNAIRAAREAISDLRARGEIGDLAFHRIQELLDHADLYTTRQTDY